MNAMQRVVLAGKVATKLIELGGTGVTVSTERVGVLSFEFVNSVAMEATGVFHGDKQETIEYTLDFEVVITVLLNKGKALGTWHDNRPIAVYVEVDNSTAGVARGYAEYLARELNSLLDTDNGEFVEIVE